MKIGQGSLPFDSSDGARNVEQFNRGAETRFAISVESENVVPEMFADVEKITRARAEIENAQRRRAIEPQVLRAFHIDVDPISNVFEAVDLGRAGPVRIFVAQISKLKPIDVVQNPTFVDRMERAAEMFERAGQELCRKKFAKLA